MFTAAKTSVANLFKSSNQLCEERTRQEILRIEQSIDGAKIASELETELLVSLFEVNQTIKLAKKKEASATIRMYTLAVPNDAQYSIFHKFKREVCVGKVKQEERCFVCDYKDPFSDAYCTCYYIKSCKYSEEQIYDATVKVQNFWKRSLRSLRYRKAKLALVQTLAVPTAISGLIQAYL